MGCTNSNASVQGRNFTPVPPQPTPTAYLRDPKNVKDTALHSSAYADDETHVLTPQIAPGKFQDKYDLTNTQLGRGSYSVVHTAICKDDESKVAVKIVSKRNLRQEDEVSIRREVAVMQKLNHPNIVQCLEFYEDEANFYIILEYIGGGELFDRLVRKTTYTESQARELALVLMRALKYCHDLGVVHRDIKPENILLTTNDDDVSIKLADFGFAVQLSNTGSVRQQAGTPGYVSPEILERKSHSKPVDIWSFGVVLYMLLGGYPPFYSNDPSNQKAIYRKILNADYTFHPEFWAHISAEAKDLISQCLQIDPNKRITIDGALRHPWVIKESEELALVDLGRNLGVLQKFKANLPLQFGTVASQMAIDAIRKLSLPNLNTLNDMRIDAIRKLSGPNLVNDAVIEAARKKSGRRIV